MLIASNPAPIAGMYSIMEPLPLPEHSKRPNAESTAWVPEDLMIRGSGWNESDSSSLKRQVWPGHPGFLEGGGCTLASALSG